MPGMRPPFGGPFGPVSYYFNFVQAIKLTSRMSVLTLDVPVSFPLVFRAPVGTMVFPLRLDMVLPVLLALSVILNPTRVLVLPMTMTLRLLLLQLNLLPL